MSKEMELALRGIDLLLENSTVLLWGIFVVGSLISASIILILISVMDRLARIIRMIDR